MTMCPRPTAPLCSAAHRGAKGHEPAHAPRAGCRYASTDCRRPAASLRVSGCASSAVWIFMPNWPLAL